MTWFRRGRATATAVLFAVIAAACSSVPPGFDRTVRGNTIEGRIAVRYTDRSTGRDEASSGRFVLSVAGSSLELSLLDPLGQTVAIVRSGGEEASIVFRDGRKLTGETPEELTQKALGWTLPLHGLRSWLDGHAEADSAFTRLDDGRLRQDGWTLRFQREDGAAADALPKRIDLAYPGPPAAIEIRLVVDQRSGP
jgi:outer membrane lipoprotein LolB